MADKTDINTLHVDKQAVVRITNSPLLDALASSPSGVLSPTGLKFTSGATDVGRPEISQTFNFQAIVNQQRLEAQLAEAKQQYAEQLRLRTADNKELRKQLALLERKNSLANLVRAVEPEAQALLMDDKHFVDQFSQENCTAFIMSVDIRKSTDLMLKAVKPKLFALFIRSLCDRLRLVVLQHHGVFDKFTGDGILAFFPDFFSGKDAGYLVVKAAAECHQVFDLTYQEHLDSFTAARADAGLGIGIDWGSVDLVSDLGGYTVVGNPVVYACRLSGAPAGKTYINQQAYKELFSKYSAFCTFERTEIEVKNEGRFYAYSVCPNGKEFTPEPPPWVSQKTERTGSSSAGDSR